MLKQADLHLARPPYSHFGGKVGLNGSHTAEGQGLPFNPRAAFELLRHAASLGDAEALRETGLLLSGGIQPPHDNSTVRSEHCKSAQPSKQTSCSNAASLQLSIIHSNADWLLPAFSTSPHIHCIIFKSFCPFCLQRPLHSVQHLLFDSMPHNALPTSRARYISFDKI